MARARVREPESGRAAGRCLTCGTPLHVEEWARELSSDFGGLPGERYAEIFWDEA